MTDDEILDIVDDNDKVIGRMSRSEVHSKNIKHFRGVNLFIRNTKGQLWIPRRAAHKQIFPLALDFSMGGHVSSGESYEEALHREMLEELNIDLSKINYHYLGNAHPKDGFFCFQRIYEVISDDVPNYNKDDFVEYYWLKPEDVIKRIEDGDKTKQDVPIMIKRFYLNES